MRGEQLEGPIPESLRLFSLCSNLNWSVLPVAGGLYDQDPRLIAAWETIFGIKNRHEAEEHSKQMNKGKSPHQVSEAQADHLKSRGYRRGL